MAILAKFVCVVALSALFTHALADKVANWANNRCDVKASRTGSDDAPTIVSAFKQCGQGGSIYLNDKLYHIESAMNTTGLRDAYIELTGTMLWGDNLTYWRQNGYELGYQNQTTAWMLGGDRVTFDGHGVGTLDGNGQLWYDLTKGVSNLPGRPISLTVTHTTNSHFTGLRFVQSQFWTLVLNETDNVLLENIYINSTSSNGNPARNTDGVDTLYSNNITFRNFTIASGDDSISMKANSTNILIQDSVFVDGLGVAIGSIGQYPGVYERIENVTAERVTCIRCRYAGYIKTWTGVEQNFPPNGGGGGLGYARNITFRDYTLSGVTASPASITQCTTFSGATGGCDTSLFLISDVTWGPFTGSVNSGTLAKLQCSGAAPCPGIKFVDFDNITTTGNRTISCRNVVDPVGFEC
ncbi:pectin lyase fold/virulence factor [Crassisporium funariophilum]|nr:pectin lyase fold/virulence factor [Crassisporium funariophilum]